MCKCSETLKTVAELAPSVIASGAALLADVVTRRTSINAAVEKARQAPRKLWGVVAGGGRLKAKEARLRSLANCRRCIWGQRAVRCDLCGCSKEDLAKYEDVIYPEDYSCWNSNVGGIANLQEHEH